MSSESESFFPPHRAHRAGSAKGKAPNEDRLYDLTLFSAPGQLMTPSCSSRKLKTYTASKLRTIANVNTSSPPNGRTPPIESSPSPRHQLLDQSTHIDVPSTTFVPPEQPAEAGASTDAQPQRGRHLHTTRRRPEKLPCIVSKVDLERAIAFTPVTERNARRRLQMQAQLEVSRQSNLTRFVGMLDGDSKGVTTAAGHHTMNGASQNGQEEDSESLGGSQEHFSVKESIREAQRVERPTTGIQFQDVVTSADHGDQSAMPEEEHEEEEFASPNGNDKDNDDDPQLDDIDRELLQLGGKNENNPILQELPSAVNSPRSPKRRRPSPDRDSPDLFDLQNQFEDDSEDFEQPSSKKQRRISRMNPKAEARDELLKELKGPRASKQSQRATTKEETKAKKSTQPKSKKKTRNVPLDELVLVSEKFDNPDAEESQKMPQELPEDPISELHVSLEESHVDTNSKKPVRRVAINIRPGKGFGTINISEFRIPKVPAGHEPQGASSHSDGFTDHEAAPTGRLMPLRRQLQRQLTMQKLTVRIGELTLVAEKRSDVNTQGRQLQDNSGNKKARKDRRPQAHVDVDVLQDEGDPMLVDAVELEPTLDEAIPQIPSNHTLPRESEHPIDEDEVPRLPEEERSTLIPEQTTPQIPRSETSVPEFPIRSSPLKEKERWMRKVSFKDQDRTISQAQPSQPDSNQSEGLFNPRHKADEVSVSQQLKMLSSSTKPVAPKKEIEVLQQLMMVSVPRSAVREGDSENESDAEDRDEDQSNSERSSDEEEEDHDSSEESGEDGDTEDEEESIQLPKTVVVPSLRREHAQNPLLDMSPGRSLDDVGITRTSATRRRPSRLQAGQATQSDEFFLVTVDNKAVDVPHSTVHNSSRRRSLPVNNNDDDSWRPREPVTDSMPMEVEDDEIVDPPTPVAAHVQASMKRRDSAMRLRRMASQELRLVASTPQSPEPALSPVNEPESQGSVELGCTQRLLKCSAEAYMQETQSNKSIQELDEEVDDHEPDIGTSQMTYLPESSYFERVSRTLRDEIWRPSPMRTKSMPASMHTACTLERTESMAGNPSTTAAFKNTIPPSRSKSSCSVGGTLLGATTPGQEKSLRSLTRQASMELGTLPNSARQRMVSLPFQPPFKKG